MDEGIGPGAVIVDCDHHPARSNGISSRRSREVMVRQLRAAQALAEALRTLGQPRGLTVALSQDAASVTIDLQAFARLWSALQAFTALAPTDDDLEPAPTGVRNGGGGE